MKNWPIGFLEKGLSVIPNTEEQAAFNLIFFGLKTTIILIAFYCVIKTAIKLSSENYFSAFLSFVAAILTGTSFYISNIFFN